MVGNPASDNNTHKKRKLQVVSEERGEKIFLKKVLKLHAGYYDYKISYHLLKVSASLLWPSHP